MKPAVASAKPSATALPAPIFEASGVMNGVMMIIPAAAGRVATPACSGLSPSAAGSWKYRLTRYISALIVPATMRIASVEPTRTRLRSRARFDDRRLHAPLDHDEQPAGDDRDDEAAERPH